MDHLIEGVKRFQREVFPEHEALFKELASQQQPDVLFITCSDSRIDPALITQTQPGDLFVCRNAGNIVPPHGGGTSGMVASIEFAVAALGVKHIVVCGHSDCGAMKGAMNVAGLDALPDVQRWLEHTRSATAVATAQGHELGAACLQRVTEENVLQQLANVATHPTVAARLATGELQLHAWMYDIGTGGVSCCEQGERAFRPLTE